jgi:hypothetical protein
MVLSVAARWLEVFERGCEPIYFVELELGPMAYVTVNDFSAGAGDTFTLSLNNGAVTYLFTEGGVGDGGFARGASNTQCATNIAAAINAHSSAGLLLYAVARGSIVTIIPIGGLTGLAVTSISDAQAWRADPEAVPQYSRFVSGEDTWASGDASTVFYPNSIVEVTPFASSIDPVTREVSVGDVEIVFAADGAMRDLIKRSRPKGKPVTLKIGAPEIQLSEFLQIGVFIIDEVVPEYGSITLRCIEPFGYSLDAKVTGEFVCMHPLACIRKILSLADVPSRFIDDASLESTSLTSTISHWAVSRHNSPSAQIGTYNLNTATGVNEPTKVKDLIDDLSRLMNGALRIREDGKYTFVFYNADASSVRHLTTDDVSDFEQVSTFENFHNRVTVEGVIDPSEGERVPLFTAIDRISEMSSGVSGTNRNFTLTIDSDWLGSVGFLHRNLSTASTTSDPLVVEMTSLVGFCGTRPETTTEATLGQTQRTADTLSSTRTAFLMLTDGTNREIIEVESYRISNAIDEFGVYSVGGDELPTTVFTEPALNNGANSGNKWLWRLGVFGIKTGGRGAKSTTAIPWIGTMNAPTADASAPTQGVRTVRVYDVTIPIAMAEARINRFAYGVPIARIRVHPRHVDLQLGDFITIDHGVYLAFSKDGADTNTVWEIISKEYQLTDDLPCVVLTLAWVRDDVALTASVVYTAETGTAIPVPAPVTQPIFDEVVTDNSDVWVTSNADEVVYR